MSTRREKKLRIKNLPELNCPRHFTYSSLSAIVLAVFFGLGVLAQYVVSEPMTADLIRVFAAAAVGSAVIMTLLPLWPVVCALFVAVWAFGPLLGPLQSLIAIRFIFSIGLIISPCFQVVDQWDKAVVLRLGKYRRICPPGPHMILPVVDTIAQRVDTRIRATDFSAEKSLTKDTVPVHVDALAFWLIWDPQKSVLEVENFMDAVTLSAQTALRDSIGKHDLTTLLSERERLGSEIQAALDAKTSPWGITILSIEFTEILIPKELEDVLSKQAQAERERQSRIILGSAEVEIAKKFEEAAERYKENPTAFQLRAMNMVYDSIRTHGGMVLLPSSALDSMSLGTTLGAAALKRVQEQCDEDSDGKKNSAIPDMQPENKKGV